MQWEWCCLRNGGFICGVGVGNGNGSLVVGVVCGWRHWGSVRAWVGNGNGSLVGCVDKRSGNGADGNRGSIAGCLLGEGRRRQSPIPIAMADFCNDLIECLLLVSHRRGRSTSRIHCFASLNFGFSVRAFNWFILACDSGVSFFLTWVFVVRQRGEQQSC